jgi:microcystin-dependent protein
MDGILGFTTLFAGNFAPVNWALCDGKLLFISHYPHLFAIIGTIYGGDGKKTFALPDLRGRAIAGAQGESWPLGATGGSESLSLTPAMFPAHSHDVTVTIKPKAASTTNSATPENAVYATGTNPLYTYGDPDTYLGNYDAVITTSEAGGKNNTPVETLHPVLALNYIICVSGPFPHRP